MLIFNFMGLCSIICLDRMRKSMKNLSLESMSPGKNLNLGSPKYEAGV